MPHDASNRRVVFVAVPRVDLAQGTPLRQVNSTCRTAGIASSRLRRRFSTACHRPPVGEPTKNESSGDKSSSDRREDEEKPSGAQLCRIESEHGVPGLVVKPTTGPG